MATAFALDSTAEYEAEEVEEEEAFNGGGFEDGEGIWNFRGGLGIGIVEESEELEELVAEAEEASLASAAREEEDLNREGVFFLEAKDRISLVEGIEMLGCWGGLLIGAGLCTLGYSNFFTDCPFSLGPFFGRERVSSRVW